MQRQCRRKKIKVIILAPDFSGLLSALQDKIWEPSGVPAVYRFWEAMVHDPHVLPKFFIFTSRADFSSGVVVIPEIGEVHVIKFRDSNKVYKCLAFLKIFMIMGWVAIKQRPDVVYTYNAAIVPAGLIARLGVVPVVIRLLGVNQSHANLSQKKASFMRWIYKSPFSYVICTEVGAREKEICNDLFNPNIPVDVRLNGVQPEYPTEAEKNAQRRKLNIAPSELIVLFSGRLEEAKGPVQFVDGCALALRARPYSFRAIMVGDGSERRAVKSAIATSGYQDQFTMLGAVSSRQMHAIYSITDIYVSLNRTGNFSNCNLEAATHGLCMAIPKENSAMPVARSTTWFFADETVVRTDLLNPVESVGAALIRLIDDPPRRQTAGKNVYLASRNLSSWQHRNKEELEILYAVATHLC